MNLSHLNHASFLVSGESVFLDLLTTFHLRNKDHMVRLFLDHCFHAFPLEDYKQFLLHMLCQPPFLSVIFDGTYIDYLAVPLREEIVIRDLRRSTKQHIKEKTNQYKEELIMRTWHPSRLFPWCLDIEELDEFGISSTDRALGRYGF